MVYFVSGFVGGIIVMGLALYLTINVFKYQQESWLNVNPTPTPATVSRKILKVKPPDNFKAQRSRANSLTKEIMDMVDREEY